MGPLEGHLRLKPTQVELLLDFFIFDTQLSNLEAELTLRIPPIGTKKVIMKLMNNSNDLMDCKFFLVAQ